MKGTRGLGIGNLVLKPFEVRLMPTLRRCRAGGHDRRSTAD
jgi:hypothetical protein